MGIFTKYLSEKFLFVIVFSLFNLGLNAQCVSTFPYVEDFENGPAWTATSVANGDWAWGSPNHTYVIKSAASGSKCWCVGGLTGAFYNYWEQSYVVSPCFDFTNLKYPHIKFKLFYDSEYKYDGGNLQYSINNGNTWINVGAYNDPADCNTQNWYNYQGITYLNNPAWISVNDGWCGNVELGGTGWDPQHSTTSCQGGHGQGHWLTAEHCLAGLAGQPNVLLRFAFGAGFACNDFDGFAFDSVAVSDGISNSATFNFTCGNLNTLNFFATPNACPTNTYSWNFGDAASGPANISSLQNPSHIFSAAGTYTVTLISSGGACNPPDTVTQVINIISATVTPFNIGCNGGMGSATINASGGNGQFTYSWNNGQTTSSATGLSAGNYSVAVSSPSSCPITLTVSISQAAPLSASVTSTPALCGQNIGTASVIPTGGVSPYTYLWNTLQTTSTITGLSGGNYSVTATDVNGCTTIATVSVSSSQGGTASIQSSSNVICNGNNSGSASAAITGGNSPFSYLWNNGQTTATATALSNGTYTIIITDANGCSSSASVTIIQPPPLNLSVTVTPASCGVAGTAIVNASGGVASYTYLWLTNPIQTNFLINNLAAGVYTVEVTDANGCTQQQSVTIPQSGSYPHADFTFNPNPINWIDPVVNFTNNSSGATVWSWSFGDGSFSSQQNPLHTYPDTGTYCITLIASDPAGICKDSITKCMENDCVFTFYIPNAFTPNADGNNEYFSGKGTCIRDFKMYVFDRWGNKIFESNDLNKGWDGKVQNGYSNEIAQEDVYVWKVNLTEYNGRQHNYVGHVALVK